MTQVMKGVRVLEVAQFTYVPAAGAILADWGADVIKIEHPVRGDTQRGFLNMGGVQLDPLRHTWFEHPNRGKRSVGIDLSTEEGQAVLYELAKSADVFLTNYRAPALEKMGLDYNSLKDDHPKLIHASVNGFGPKGPDAGKAMLDGVAASRGGLVHQTGYADRESTLPGAIIIDTAGAMQLALGVLSDFAGSGDVLPGVFSCLLPVVDIGLVNHGFQVL